MEIVREDGSVIELNEGERRELGRGSVFDSKRDKSVSRLHVIMELLRPASRKGKEVIGKSTALKLQLQVVGRNPICIISTTSKKAEDSRSRPPIQFAGKGEMDWLDPGDRFSLSVRQPFFFVLRQCSRGGLRGDGMVESHSAGRTTNSVENNLKSMAEKNVIGGESNSLEEEEGIARAVARRQRRRLERDMEQQRMRLSEQQSQNDDGLENSDQVEPGAESHEEASVVPPRQTNVLGPVDLVSEFGFIVKGSEFQAYEKRSTTENGPLWNWKIDKKGEIGEDSVEGKDGESKMNNKNSLKIARPEKDDEEWGGDDNEEKEKLSKAQGSKAKSKVCTRSSRSNSSYRKGKIPQTLNPQLSNPSGRVSNDGEDMSDFLVEDDDSIEEEGEDEDEDEDEADWMDDDETVPHQTEKRVTKEEKQKPACKYGSNCYRKNKEHLSQFSHPQR